MQTQKAITFDIDWAPDWTIDLCQRICAAQQTKATFFITHETPILSALQQNDLFELGIHPNFLKNSSHGDNEHAILEHCLQLAPNASAMRTHALVQSSFIFALIADHYPQLTTDVSLLLPHHKNLAVTEIYMGNTNRQLIRIPYFWEDDIAAVWPKHTWAFQAWPHPGLQIYDFHPIHIALNTDTLDRYNALKQNLGGKHLSELTETDVAPYVNPGLGARTYLESLLANDASNNFFKIHEITDHYLGHQHENSPHRQNKNPAEHSETIT
jgi:Polysaccharide deacetylase